VIFNKYLTDGNHPPLTETTSHPGVQNINLKRNSTAHFRKTQLKKQYGEAITQKYLPDDDHISSEQAVEMTFIKEL
jgi:hypothetical protein